MAEQISSPLALSQSRWKPWQIILFFGVLLFLVNTLGAFWVEPYSGSCMFVLLAYFTALVVILPVLLIRRFGVGAAVYLPYMLLGVGFDYYFEWVVQRTLLSPWYALVWSLLGPATGLLVDVAYRLLPTRLHDHWKAAALGIVLALGTFFLTRWGLMSFYVQGSSASAGHMPFFQEKAIFSLPWMVINGAFGGYTAYALARKI
jgi:hypothetical protein